MGQLLPAAHSGLRGADPRDLVDRNHATCCACPSHRAGDTVSSRIEYRLPDSACNPYLAFASLLAAGLAGVERELPLPEPLDRDVRELDADEVERARSGSSPPRSARRSPHFDGSDLMRDALGEHVLESLVANKRHEWNEYRSQISDFEIERYLGVL